MFPWPYKIEINTLETLLNYKLGVKKSSFYLLYFFQCTSLNMPKISKLPLWSRRNQNTAQNLM